MMTSMKITRDLQHNAAFKKIRVITNVLVIIASAKIEFVRM